MNRLKIFCFVLLMSVMINVDPVMAREPWGDLFDGESLSGWQQIGGEAKYTVKNGQIIGETVPDTPNSFLCTKQHYGDFILEVEFKLNGPLNSGIQIRSNSFSEYNDGQVHGYQVEIDPSDREWTGGIYDEGRRGWLNTLEGNPAAQKAYQAGQWNKFRIEAIGNTIKTWLNDVPASHLYDTMTRSGFIALQVHGIGKHKERVGLQVSWKNIRILDNSPASYIRSTPLPQQNMDNKLGNR